MKPFWILSAVVTLLLAAWVAHRSGSPAKHDGQVEPVSPPDLDPVVALKPSRAASGTAAAAVAPAAPPAKPPPPTAEEMAVKINMLRRDLEHAKNDGHRMFILRRIADNCTRAGSFLQCGQVLEGVSDLVTEPPMSEELRGIIETMRRRAQEGQEKSGSRERSPADREERLTRSA
jgi:hypothetical protein